MNNNGFSELVSAFHEYVAPEPGYLAGYGAIIHKYALQVPMPARLALISRKHKKYEVEEWRVFTPRYKPEDTLVGHLTFALKYEGIDLAVLKALFLNIGDRPVIEMIASEPTGQYSRRVWFLFEWLMGRQLDIPDLKIGNTIPLIDEALQYSGHPENSRRHRVTNNLPGTVNFCPLIRKTEKLEQFINGGWSDKIKDIIGTVHADVMGRAAAFLLLKDSKASYAIEGEHPPQNRAQRWAKAIGMAGQKPLTKEELLRLQQIVIDNVRFIKMGWREEGGFVGEHDRSTGSPIPDHISAKWQDIEVLINGLVATSKKLEQTNFDAVLAAAMIAFGFVFIHPFVDGNGRIHRYLIHDVLIRKNFAPKGLVFPVSAVILERLQEYRETLEAFSLSRLDLIEWQPTLQNNVEVKNETIDLYRYYDATKQAEFLYSCVQQTIESTLPEEVDYLNKYDRMKSYIDEYFDMPDKMVALLVRFLQQNQGKFSLRAKEKEFAALSEDEIMGIEKKYIEVFG